MKFDSQYFDTADDLVEAKNDAWAPVEKHRKRLKIVREFVNMIPTLSEEEMEQLNRTEATNFGTIYRDMLQNEAMFTSMTTGIRGLVEIKVDTNTGDIQKDTDDGMYLSDFINRGAIDRKGKFHNFWRKCGGEIVIAGGVPAVQNPRYGWCPEPKPDMFFPRGTNIESDSVTFAFDPVELTMASLKEMQREAGKREEGEDSIYDKKALDTLVSTLKDNIKNRMSDSGRKEGHNTQESVRDDNWLDRKASIPAWWYYEVKFDEDDGQSYVSATLFTDNLTTEGGFKANRQDSDAAKIIAYDERAYEDAAEWLEMVAIDSEIGGVKNVDTLRGVAEMVFGAAMEVEELFNLLLEGDKQRAKPRYRITDNAKEDDVLKWNVYLDSFVPEGVEEFETKSNAQHLLTPINFLQQTTASMSSAPFSNNGRNGELRQQALERQQSNSAIISSRLSEAYNRLDSILETIVMRILTSDIKPGCDGYQDIAWIREQLKSVGVDFEKLAERKHGRFVYLQVRAKRVIGAGNREQQMEVAKELMANLQNYPPDVRPLILRMYTTLMTSDPDMAAELAPFKKATINPQKLDAENEADTILRRAALGQVLPLNPTDIHQDHIPVHLLDMQALVARGEMVPWTRLDVFEFAGLAEHTMDHIQVLLQNPATNIEGKPFLRDYQRIVSAAQPLIDASEEQYGSEQGALTAAEMADLELKMAAERRKWVEMGMKAEDMKNVQQQRMAREMTSRRSQYASEVQASQRLQLDKVKTAEQIASRKQSAKQSAQQSKK